MPGKKATARSKSPPGAGKPRKPSAEPSAVRAEWQRIAQHLHDTACQTLTGARMLASTLRGAIPAGDDGAVAKLQTLEKQLAQASEELQALIRELRRG